MSEELARTATCQYLEGERSGGPDSKKVSTQSILEALDLCLQNNVFSFNEKKYRQKGGVGTGNKMSPPLHMPGYGQI